MGSNTVLRLRRNAAQLQALAQVEREIRATDSKGRWRYLRDFAESYRTYDVVRTHAQRVYGIDWLGQMLGTELYEAYLSGRVAKRFLRSLFMRPLHRPGTARAAYHATVRKIKRPPKRLAS